MSHGIGRSGDVAATQPKAAGSSLLVKLTERLTRHAVQLAGMPSVDRVLLLPLATGMALLMTFLALARLKPNARHVIWSRIDQKTCLKAMLSAGLVPVIVQPRRVEDQL
jgi:O-phospho-L-seryl-tRNASec:L-selenocysteinyl-tRNA synthase